MGPKVRHPKHSTGINGWCPLGELPMFDLVWDICPDMMHIIKNLFERFFGSLLRGERIPKPPKKTFHPPKANDENYTAKLASYTKDLTLLEESKKRATLCTLSNAGKEQIDIRYRTHEQLLMNVQKLVLLKFNHICRKPNV
jgi:hypothetical protein